ncbi:hypothetical protein AFIC_001024 [[Pseudomonas] carboxydohydrogena]|uniref:Uncharacterized protein n=1 Tax=Afipia carboxydohydrogena TaxID=290 RepID=A0ABY8BRF0_AFICR|nr:hypothetical protein [[Pseudomonas] carboxydohydrogena]WEF52533.1 hypothetical protein AFIC_001024 [[Pseudomonas] carboxydohydrogena]
MKDFRKVEEELIAAFDAQGVEISRVAGDAFACVISVPECGKPSGCEIVIGPYGKTECAHCEMEVNLNGRMTSIDLTKLAKRLCE